LFKKLVEKYIYSITITFLNLMRQGECMAIKKEYLALQKQYDLPPFDDMNKEFEIDAIEKFLFPLREVRNRMIDQLGGHACLLEGVLSPDQKVSAFYEGKFLSKDDLGRAFRTYKDIMALIRMGQNNALAFSEKVDAAFIREVWHQWPDIKTALRVITQRLTQGWSSNIQQKYQVEYFG